MKSLGCAVAALALMGSEATAREYEVVTRADIEYAARADAKHAGDLYLPKDLDASPISYATVDKNRTRFFLVQGTADDIVDMATQTAAFLKALKQAGFFARAVIIPGAGRFWVADPVEEAGSNGLQ